MCRNCDWEGFLVDADSLLDDLANLPESAEDFAGSVTEKVESICRWVEGNEHCTENQRTAVENIAEGVDRWKN